MGIPAAILIGAALAALPVALILIVASPSWRGRPPSMSDHGPKSQRGGGHVR